MQYLYEICTRNLSWLVGGPSDNHGSLEDNSSQEVSDPLPVYLPRSNQPQEKNEEKVDLYDQINKDVEPEVDPEESPDEENKRNHSVMQEKPERENDNEVKEQSENSNTNARTDEEDKHDYKTMDINTFKNANVEINAPVNASINKLINTSADAHPPSYAAYFAACDEIAQQEKDNEISTQDGESGHRYESVLEKPPLVGHKLPTEGFELPEYPSLTDLEPTTDFSLALKAGHMPRLCTHCFRWEDQPDDEYEEKDMVSDKCCMLGNIVFFRKIKPFWTQCSACGFGMPKKMVRGRRISRVKKFLCKVVGKEYKGYEFKRFGYEWMSEEGRNKGLSHYL